MTTKSPDLLIKFSVLFFSNFFFNYNYYFNFRNFSLLSFGEEAEEDEQQTNMATQVQ